MRVDLISRGEAESLAVESSVRGITVLDDGAPLTGAINLVDSLGHALSSVSNEGGKFRMDVSGLTPRFYCVRRRLMESRSFMAAHLALGWPI
jgi:hypothetical protein